MTIHVNIDSPVTGLPLITEGLLTNNDLAALQTTSRHCNEIFGGKEDFARGLVVTKNMEKRTAIPLSDPARFPAITQLDLREARRLSPLEAADISRIHRKPFLILDPIYSLRERIVNAIEANPEGIRTIASSVLDIACSCLLFFQIENLKALTIEEFQKIDIFLKEGPAEGLTGLALAGGLIGTLAYGVRVGELAIEGLLFLKTQNAFEQISNQCRLDLLKQGIKHSLNLLGTGFFLYEVISSYASLGSNVLAGASLLEKGSRFFLSGLTATITSGTSFFFGESALRKMSSISRNIVDGTISLFTKCLRS